MKKVFFLLLGLAGCVTGEKKSMPEGSSQKLSANGAPIDPKVSVSTGGEEVVFRNPTAIEGADIDGGNGKSN